MIESCWPGSDSRGRASSDCGLGRSVVWGQMRSHHKQRRRCSSHCVGASDASHVAPAVLDGASREEAATIGGMDRQTLRGWVIRFNEQGADGLINIPSPGVPPKLNSRHKAFLARIVEEGPIPAIHGVVRWRACDLIMRLYEEFGL